MCTNRLYDGGTPPLIRNPGRRGGGAKYHFQARAALTPLSYRGPHNNQDTRENQKVKAKYT